METEQKKTVPEEKTNTKKPDTEDDDLTDEDRRLKEELETLVGSVQDNSSDIAANGLKLMKKAIRESTSSMTSVPKPLKFLSPHVDTLKEAHNEMPDGENKKMLSDILSVLSMTIPNTERLCLTYRLSGLGGDVGEWGHEYVQHLSAEIAAEYDDKGAEPKIMALVEEIVPYYVTHNARPEACDLLLEVEQLEKILEFIDEDSYHRICIYLIQCANYLPGPEDKKVLDIVRNINKKVGNIPGEMRVALQLDRKDYVKEIYENCTDPNMKRQLAFMLARQHYFDLINDDDDMDMDDEDEEEFDEAQEELNEELTGIVTNSKLSDYFLQLAKELDLMEPKTPEDIYKTHLEQTRNATRVDSARQNLASTFTNGFVNAGYRNDTLMSGEASNTWIFKNKEHGMMSATASLGLINIWDIEGGCQKLDKFMYSNQDYIKAGALLGIGIVNSGVRDAYGAALGLLREPLEENKSGTVKTAAALGLGIAYCSSGNEDIKELLLPLLEGSNTMEVTAHYALALGLVFAGTCDGDITETLLATILDKGETGLSSTWARFLSLALGLLYLGKQEAAEVVLETLKGDKPFFKFSYYTVDTLAYAGSGNVLKVQEMLHACSEHLEKDDEFQSVATLGIALISMCEEIGADMVIRSFDHLLQYGELNIRRTVPLALGLLRVGNPEITVMDTLSKLSHDHDGETAMGAILSLGLIGAGTNNSRIAQLLRNLAVYYNKEPNHKFLVRFAQGLLYMGKGTIGLQPFHSEGNLMSPVAVAGLISVMYACTDFKNIILGKAHYLLYLISLSMYPRILMTFDEEMNPLQVTVRVGQAVDVVGQAGKPKSITGFQTHQTPVLLQHGERAEMANDEHIPLSSVLEGFVILKPNPEARKKLTMSKNWKVRK